MFSFVFYMSVTHHQHIQESYQCSMLCTCIRTYIKKDMYLGYKRLYVYHLLRAGYLSYRGSAVRIRKQTRDHMQKKFLKTDGMQYV